MKAFFGIFSLIIGGMAMTFSATAETYAEKLGWEPGAKVVILHIDDTGMSHASNKGTIRAMDEGVATSCSIMMPCSWVSEYYHYLQKNPNADTGLHLTLTSEWAEYRWGPLAGKAAVPGLVDKEGCLWGSVEEVIANATPDEVETEIRAQIDLAQTMGFEITHLDSHMGTLFASPLFLQRYVQIGIEYQIPVLLPGGHMHYISQENPMPKEMVQGIAKQLWDAGLPVVDDIFADTYGWKGLDKTDNYIELLKNMKPGILEVVMHCSDPDDEIFPIITDSSVLRKGDMLAMMDPKFKAFIEKEGIILTTWRELKARRDNVGK
jgi:predicted glycoside hydrolase/deacetylase ChbG (UPF0249 family)